MQIPKMGIKLDTQQKPQTNKEQHYKQPDHHRTSIQLQWLHCHTIHSGPV